MKWHCFQRIFTLMLFFCNIQNTNAQSVAQQSSQLDSVLRIDKDNVLCLYGFRNGKDEWAIPPRYESITIIQDTYFIVNHNNKYGLLNQYGKTIVAEEWDYLEALTIYRSIFDRFMYGTYDRLSSDASYYPHSAAQLRCRKGNLYGAINLEGKIILNPEYQEVRQCYNNLYEVKVGNEFGILDAQKQFIVPPTHQRIIFTLASDLFIVVDALPQRDSDRIYENFTYGLVNAAGKILLPNTTALLKMDAHYPYFFQKIPLHDWNQVRSPQIFHGLRGWLWDSVAIHGTEYTPNPYRILFTMDSANQKRYALTDTAMNHLLNFNYQRIRYSERYNADAGHDETLFHCAKQGKWGVFDPKHQKWILPMMYDSIQEFANVYCVLYNGKWQFINEARQSVLFEQFDDVGNWNRTFAFNATIRRREFFFVAQHDTLFFYKLYDYTHKFTFDDIKKYLNDDNRILFGEKDYLTPVGGRDYVYYVNSKGRIILSPKEELVWAKEGTVLARNKTSKQQYLIDKQGNKHLFLPQYNIKSMDIKQNWVVVEDTLLQRLGMLRMDGTERLPFHFVQMTGVDTQGTIWARRWYAPIINNSDTAMVRPLEKWELYDTTGRQVVETPFDAPFKWCNELGIGQVNHKMGIWNAKGQCILPPNYDKIGYEPRNNIFYLFKWVHDKVYEIGFANNEGQLVIDAVLKNMTEFMGHRAIVETAEGYGIIQKTGQYEVKPHPTALRQVPFSIPDWVYFSTNESFPMNLGLPHDIVLERIQLSNLLLEYVLPSHFINVQNIVNQRYRDYFQETTYQGSHQDEAFSGRWQASQPPYLCYQHLEVKRIIPTPKRVHMTLFKKHEYNSYENILIYYNFKLENNIWRKVNLSDFLRLNKKNEAKLNQLLIQKIGALKYVNLDCGHPDFYFERVRDKFHVLEEGIQFFMPHQQSDEAADIPILLTWAVLQPFRL